MTDLKQTSPDGEFVVVIDDGLQDLIPGYLENRRQDIVAILSALERADFESIRAIGHKMKGSGGGYGFDMITEIGSYLEAAAKNAVGRDVREQVDRLRDYLDRLKIVYQP
jgi:HPt (histidine-containing phosphotransfer) domain-containing protein